LGYPTTPAKRVVEHPALRDGKDAAQDARFVQVRHRERSTKQKHPRTSEVLEKEHRPTGDKKQVAYTPLRRSHP
jgi:hypothetical protein